MPYKLAVSPQVRLTRLARSTLSMLNGQDITNDIEANLDTEHLGSAENMRTFSDEGAI